MEQPSNSAGSTQAAGKSSGAIAAGSAAWLGGLWGLSISPLVGVLLILGGMALTITAAQELFQESASREADAPVTNELCHRSSSHYR